MIDSSLTYLMHRAAMRCKTAMILPGLKKIEHSSCRVGIPGMWLSLWLFCPPKIYHTAYLNKYLKLRNWICSDLHAPMPDGHMKYKVRLILHFSIFFFRIMTNGSLPRDKKSTKENTDNSSMAGFVNPHPEIINIFFIQTCHR